jgi:WD40 repeat protein
MRRTARSIAFAAFLAGAGLAGADPATPTVVVTGLGDHPGHLAVSPDGKSLVVADSDHALRVVDLATGKTIRTLKGHKYDVDFVGFPAPEADALVSMGGTTDPVNGRGVLRIWQWSTGGVRQDIEATSKEGLERAYEVATSPSGRDVAISMSSCKLRVLDAKGGRSPVDVQGAESFIADCLAFSADGARLLSVDKEHTGATVVRLYFRAEPKARWKRIARFVDEALAKDEPDVAKRLIWQSAVLVDGRVIARGWLGPDDADETAPRFDVLRSWAAESGAVLWSENRERMEVRELLSSPHGLVVAMDDAVEVRDIADGRPKLRLPKPPKSIRRAAISPDGRFVFASLYGGSVVRWDLGEAK